MQAVNVNAEVARPAMVELSEDSKRDLASEPESKRVPGWDSKVPQLIGLVAIAFLFIGFGSWSVFAKIDGAVLAPGRLQVDSVKQVIQHPEDGVVSEVLVVNGDIVNAGDVVVRLDSSELSSELKIYEDELFGAMAEASRLEAIVDGSDELIIPELLGSASGANPELINPIIAKQRSRLTDSRTALSQKVGLIQKQSLQMSNQIEGVQSQITAKSNQLKTIRAELADSQAAAAKGLIRKSALYSLQKEKALAEGEVGRLRARIGELQTKIAELELEVLALPLEKRERSAEALEKLIPDIRKLTEQRRNTLKKMEHLNVKTPVSGAIHDTRIYGVRSVVKAATPIMHVIPNDRPVVLLARVDANDVDQVFVDQVASLRFRSFSRRSTPVIFGTIESISADAYTDPTSKKPYFDVEVAISDEEILKIGKDNIKPGMPVDVFLATDKRSPLSYLTRPLTDYFGRAFRDS